MGRLGLASLATLWVAGVFMAWVMFPTWFNFPPINSDSPGPVLYWVFGWIPFAGVAYVPFAVYEGTK